MTFIEAAQAILRQNGNQPMSSSEIWAQIDRQKMIQTKGKTPCASLNTIILFQCKDTPITKQKVKNHEIFRIVDRNPMKFVLDNDSLFNEIVDIKEENKIEEKIFLYSVMYPEKLGWGKRLSVYNNNDSIEILIEDADKITYFMIDPAQDTIKIGKASMSNDPNSRLGQMRTGNPRLELSVCFPFEQYSEPDLHQKFDDFWKDREWFFHSKILKNFIEKEQKKIEKTIQLYEEKLKLERIEKELLNIL